LVIFLSPILAKISLFELTSIQSPLRFLLNNFISGDTSTSSSKGITIEKSSFNKFPKVEIDCS